MWVFIRGSDSLRRYILTRIALTLPMVLILVSVVFFVLRVMPGDVVSSTLGPKASEEVRENIMESLGLDDPLIIQYFKFLGDVITLDLGDSFIGARRPIVDELGERLPATLELIIPAALVALGTGLLFGTYAAIRRKRAADYCLRLYSVIVYSMPIFWLGLLLRLVFSVWLGWTPIAGRIDVVANTTLERTTNLLVVDSIITGNWSALSSVLHHMILPAMTLGSGPLGRVHPPHQDQRDRDAAGGLRHLGAGQGHPGARRQLLLRPQERHDPGGHRDRAPGGHPAGGRRADRDGLQLAGDGQVPDPADQRA